MTSTELLNLTPAQKLEDVWLSGIRGKGIFKQWYDNGQLKYLISYTKNWVRHGEYKTWTISGRETKHQIWKNNKLIKKII